MPGIVVRGPANRPLRFFGMPGGNEFPNFIETIVEASKTKVELGAETAKQLKKLKDNVSIAVYVTPTCPYCPRVVRAAYRLALASAHVEASAVEIGEFPRLAQQLGVRAVPLTVLNNDDSDRRRDGRGCAGRSGPARSPKAGWPRRQRGRRDEHRAAPSRGADDGERADPPARRAMRRPAA